MTLENPNTLKHEMLGTAGGKDSVCVREFFQVVDLNFLLYEQYTELWLSKPLQASTLTYLARKIKQMTVLVRLVKF